MYKFYPNKRSYIMLTIAGLFGLITMGAVLWDSFTNFQTSPMSGFILGIPMFIASLFLLGKFIVLRVPIISVNDRRVEFHTAFFMEKAVLLKDIKRVTIDEKHPNKRVIVESQYKKYFISTKETTVTQKELQKAIRHMKSKKNS